MKYDKQHICCTFVPGFNRSAAKHEKNGYVDGFVNLANLS